MNNTVLILHDQISTNADNDELDVLVQAENISKSLKELG